MASYTRQSTFSDGDLITAALFNNEYNQLVDAFDNALGHKHDGTVGEGPVLSVLGDAGLATPLNKILVDTTNDHIEFYIDVSGTSTQQLYIADGAIVPTTNNDVDLGTSALKFKDLYLSGNTNIAGNAVVTGNLTVEGTTVTLNTATLDVEDKNITLNYGAGDTSSNADGAGITIQDAVDASTDATILWNATNDRFDFSHAIDVTGSATVDGLTSNGDITVNTENAELQLVDTSSGNTTSILSNNFDTTISADGRMFFRAGGSADNIIQISSGGDISFYEDTGTTAKFFWDASAESLGIGTTSPQAKLQINDGDLYFDNDSYSDNNRIGFGNPARNGDAGYIDYIGQGNFTGHIAFGLVTSATNTAATEVARFDNNGRLGIGTQVPSTTLDVNGTITYGSLSDGTITITGFADEDNMVSNSATLVPTQQSVKAYVDSQVGTVDTLSEILANGNTTGGTDIAFGDNDKAVFGTGSDLSIYHDGSNSRIVDTGTGDLSLEGANVRFRSTNGDYYAYFTSNAESSLYYNNAIKLATTSTGIDVTGEGKFTDLTNGGLVHARGLDASLFLDITSGNNAKIYYDSGDLEFKATNPTAVDSSVSMKIAQNRDISFYDSTGTTQGFFWDASDEQLGIGTTNPAYTLDVNSGTTNDTVRFKSSDDTVTIVLEDDDSLNEIESSAVGIRFDLSGSEKLRVNSTGIDVTGRTTTDGLTTSASLISTSNSNSLGGTTFTSSISTVGLNSSAAITSTSNSNSFGGTSFTSNIDVTGTVTSDGLTVQTTQGDIAIANSASSLNFTRAGTNYIRATDAAGHFKFITGANDFATQRLNIASNGDISFYDDTGTTQGLFWDSSAETLAIGHTSPSSTYRLDIAGSIRSFGNAPSLTLREDDASNQTWLMASYGGTFAVRDTTVSGTAYPFQIEAATPSNTLYLDSTGKIGIGTATPSSTLHIKSGTENSSVARFEGFNPNRGLEISTGADATVNDVFVHYNQMLAGYGGHKFDVGDSTLMTIDHSGNVGIGTSSPTNYSNFTTLAIGNSTQGGVLEFQYAGSQAARIATTAANTLQFVTNNTEAMRINSSGSVGIGTTSIGKTLTVGGSGLRVQSTASADFYSTGQDALVVNNGTANLRFWNNGSERLRIDSVGQVGIGNTAPAKNLHITDSLSPTIRFSRDNSFYWDIGHTSSDFQFISESGGTVLHMNYDGKVGIGTTSPGEKLSVSGGIIRVQNGSNTTFYEEDKIHSYAANGYVIDGREGLILETSTADTDIILSPTGKVGIGTTSPATTLDVAGSGAEIAIRDTRNISWTIGDTVASLGFYSDDVSGGSGSTSNLARGAIDLVTTSTFGSTHDMVFRTRGDISTSAVERLRITSVGNVGIGTDSPQAKLHIDSTGDALQFTRTGQETYKVTHGTSGLYTLLGSTIAIGVTQNHDFGVYDNTGSPYAMFDGSTSRVGIGTTSPSQALEVAGNIQATGTRSISALYDSNHYMKIEANSSGGILKGTDGGVTTTFVRTYGDSYFNGGNVGIGTDSPSAKLDVSSATGSATITPTELLISSSTQASDWSVTDPWGVLGFYSADASGGGAGNRAEISANMENTVGGFASLDFKLQDPSQSYAKTSWLTLKNSSSFATRQVLIEADGGLYVEGNVGIGIASPAEELHVFNAGNTTVQIQTSGGGTPTLKFTSPVGTEEITTGVGSIRNMVFRIAGLERARFDASGNLLVGKTSSSFSTAGVELASGGTAGKVQIQRSSSPLALVNLTDDGNILNFYKGTSAVGSIGTVGGEIYIESGDVGLQFNASGNNIVPYGGGFQDGVTSIGASANRFKDLYLSGKAYVGSMNVDAGNADGIKISSTAPYLFFNDTDTAHSYDGSISQSGTTLYVGGATPAQGIVFRNKASFGESARIDSSGNFGIGQTNPLTPLHVSTAKSSVTDSVLTLQDTTETFGKMIEFVGQGATDCRGIIGFQEPEDNAPELYIANGGVESSGNGVGLAFWSYITVNRIIPCDNLGALRDNVIDLGSSNARFDDIYATNGTIQTSDRNDKQDIEEITDAETRVAVACKGLIRKFRWKSAVAEKDDNSDSDETARIHFGIIAQDLQDAFTAEGLDAGDYAMFTSQTWEDSDGVEQTRLGVRYSELLAFIIAAI